ncbi:urease accessory protein UreE [Nibricoccus sp. IMCC34717]|uniref:urease accessory protein UreE n=1 Tax=Nibricoccus sp. IMCC34717 TaxID=3034021 RepID=UPI00384EA3C2
MVIHVTQCPPGPFPEERVSICCPRRQAMKRRWRGVANDGVCFVFELERPLLHGEVAYVADGKAYVVEVDPEPLLAISLDLPASAVAGVAWAIGNRHLELMGEAQRLLTPDEPATRQFLDRIGIAYAPVVDRFRPGRFARGSTGNSDELGPSHSH